MTQNRSVNVFGKVHGVISTGDGARIMQSYLENAGDVAEEIEEILEQLAVRYDHTSEFQKKFVLQMEIQQKLKTDPTFRQRFINATKSGGLELIKVVTNNPFVSVPLETVKGWIEAEPSP
jgi:hypothetical protein